MSELEFGDPDYKEASGEGRQSDDLPSFDTTLDYNPDGVDDAPGQAGVDEAAEGDGRGDEGVEGEGRADEGVEGDDLCQIDSGEFAFAGAAVGDAGAAVGDAGAVVGDAVDEGVPNGTDLRGVIINYILT